MVKLVKQPLALLMITFLFTATITLSAFLLFLVQPLIAKPMLPLLGGGPSVWNTAMVFFQAMLLLGYLYAHLGQHWLGLKRHALLHVILLCASCILLPIALVPGLDGLATDQPLLWTLATLFLSVGIPFFLLSANAPLIQRWCGQVPSNAKENPYILYSASNIGSFVALLGFPLVLEWLFPVTDLFDLWSLAYVVLILCIAGTVWVFSQHYTEPKQTKRKKKAKPIARGQKFYWIALAFIPSSLMLGVTSYVTTDIASFPLLWVVPLSLYLLSFVVAFLGWGNARPKLFKWSFWSAIAALALIMLNAHDYTAIVFAHLIIFFLIALAFHTHLESLKPEVEHLTLFYLCLSVGGVFGGIVNALVAPMLFNSMIEYPIVLLLAVLIHPRIYQLSGSFSLKQYMPSIKETLPVLLGLAAVAGIYWVIGEAGSMPEAEQPVILGANLLLWLNGGLIFAFVLSLLLFHKDMRKLSFFIVSIFLLVQVLKISDSVFMDRNFFGVSVVSVDEENQLMKYRHGTTLHGIQSLQEEWRLRPIAYYSALKEVFDLNRSAIRSGPFAILGLGAGTLTCYGAPGQEVDVFEIDPIVVEVAENPELFTYMRDCPPKKNVLLGDARILLQETIPDDRYSLIIADAFSSDSVPIHLITKEAVALYFDKIQPGGILAMHVSNRHVRLQGILGDIVNELGLHAKQKNFSPPEGTDTSRIFASHWVIIAEDPWALRALTADRDWQIIERASRPAWSDSYSNVVAAILDRYWAEMGAE